MPVINITVEYFEGFCYASYNDFEVIGATESEAIDALIVLVNRSEVNDN